MNAMKMKFIPKNDSLVKAVEQQFLDEAGKYEKQKNEVKAYFTYKKMINYVGDLADMGNYVTKVDDLQKSDKVKKYLSDELTDEQQEMQTESALINYLSEKDIDWWKGTVDQMRNFIKKDSLSPVALQNQRLLSYLSLATYMGAMQAYKGGNTGAMSHFLDLYKMVDPTNPEHSYLYAYIYMHENNTDKAISSLDDAIKLGFIDAGRMQSDSNFVALKNVPAFKELVKKIQNAPPKLDITQ